MLLFRTCAVVNCKSTFILLLRRGGKAYLPGAKSKKKEVNTGSVHPQRRAGRKGSKTSPLTQAMNDIMKLIQLMKKTRPCILVNGLHTGSCWALSVKGLSVGFQQKRDDMMS